MKGFRNVHNFFKFLNLKTTPIPIVFPLSPDLYQQMTQLSITKCPGMPCSISQDVFLGKEIKDIPFKRLLHSQKCVFVLTGLVKTYDFE